MQVHCFTDGCRGQYKGRRNFHRIASFPSEHEGVRLLHHFAAGHHFKGPHDAYGKDPKFLARMAERQQRVRLATTHDLYTFCVETLPVPKKLNAKEIIAPLPVKPASELALLPPEQLPDHLRGLPPVDRGGAEDDSDNTANGGGGGLGGSSGEGAGREGAGREGVGHEGAGREGAGREGASREGTSREDGEDGGGGGSVSDSDSGADSDAELEVEEAELEPADLASDSETEGGGAGDFEFEFDETGARVHQAAEQQQAAQADGTAAAEGRGAQADGTAGEEGAGGTPGSEPKRQRQSRQIEILHQGIGSEHTDTR